MINILYLRKTRLYLKANKFYILLALASALVELNQPQGLKS